MPLSVWSVTRLGLVAAAWIVLVALIGPRIGPRPATWTMTAPNGTVELRGTAHSPRRDLYVAAVAFGPPFILLALWWLQRR
jgi:hypothetical protein